MAEYPDAFRYKMNFVKKVLENENGTDALVDNVVHDSLLVWHRLPPCSKQKDINVFVNSDKPSVELDFPDCIPWKKKVAEMEK